MNTTSQSLSPAHCMATREWGRLKLLSNSYTSTGLNLMQCFGSARIQSKVPRRSERMAISEYGLAWAGAGGGGGGGGGGGAGGAGRRGGGGGGGRAGRREGAAGAGARGGGRGPRRRGG